MDVYDEIETFFGFEETSDIFEDDAGEIDFDETTEAMDTHNMLQQPALSIIASVDTVAMPNNQEMPVTSVQTIVPSHVVDEISSAQPKS